MASKWIGKTVRLSIYTRDNNVCCYCGKQCEHLNGSGKDAITLDHIVSQKELAAASTDDADFKRKQRDPKNLVVACMNCNSSKRDLSLYVWASQTGKDYPAILIEIGKRIQQSV